MARVERTIEVRRPQDEAFAYAADFSKIAEWDPNVVRSEALGAGLLEPGAGYRVVIRMGPGRLALRYEIEQIDPPRRIRLRARGGGMEVVDELFFEPLPGGTEIRWVAEIALSGALGWFDGLTARSMEGIADRAMAGLQSALDGHGRAGRRPGLLARLGDHLVLPGVAQFSRLGYAARRLDAKPVEVDLRGRTAVVTGATSGLGLATAHGLARLGARVVLVGRARDKLERVHEEIAAASQSPNLAIECADLSLMREVRALAGRLRAAEPALHVLVNNAGVLVSQRDETDEGLERTLATNLLGHFVLTGELLPLLERSAPSRIVNVSSGGMYTQRIRVDDLGFSRGRYDGTVAYASTKRGQVILTELWAERLRGTGVMVNSMHPGWADTPGVESSLPGFYRVTRRLLRTPAQGADTILWLAAAPEAERETGKFWFDRQPHPTHVLPGTRESEGERRKLWTELERLADAAPHRPR
jgi:NAD(P)-dependent dehydrogenase (short-subunit alcohol dehydrogenase family)/carbon monoxide dehydrogenase subunit G